MELNEDGFLEELLSLRRETWDTNPLMEINTFFSNNNTWDFNTFDANPPPLLPNESFSSSMEPSLDCSFNEFYPPFSSKFSSPFPAQEDYSVSVLEEDYNKNENVNNFNNLDQIQGACKVEPAQSAEIPPFNVGLCMERKKKVKKLEGQPSKNLMAERRRRKRLNDRLSMLRSVVPKISKMDRTSILGDTIDYMKELLQRINTLQEEIDVGSSQWNVMNIFKELKPNDVLVRNSPKFDVERREMDTRVEICCAGKPGLLLSTVTTLEALGLEIQQCVISCFNDFSLQASCSEELEQRNLISSEDIKQALFRNAGYGGRCL